MSEYTFGVGTGFLSPRANAIAEAHGAYLVNYCDAECKCGLACYPHCCKASRRHWFCTPEGDGSRSVETAVMDALRLAGLLKPMSRYISG